MNQSLKDQQRLKLAYDIARKVHRNMRRKYRIVPEGLAESITNIVFNTLVKEEWVKEPKV